MVTVLVFVVDLAMIPDSYLQVWSCRLMFNTLCIIFIAVKLSCCAAACIQRL